MPSIKNMSHYLFSSLSTDHSRRIDPTEVGNSESSSIDFLINWSFLCGLLINFDMADRQPAEVCKGAQETDKQQDSIQQLENRFMSAGIEKQK